MAAPGRVAAAKRVAQRAWPYAKQAYRRWDELTPQQKERYRKMASDAAQRGRKALAQRSERSRRRSQR